MLPRLPTPPLAQDEIESLRREGRTTRPLRGGGPNGQTSRRARATRGLRQYATESSCALVLLDTSTGVPAPTAGVGGNVVEGVELIQREMLRVLERAGLARYSAVGQPFDPARHEAIARVVSGEAAPDTVVHETAPGYLLHGRVLRPALVAVAAAPDEDAA